MIDNRPTFSYPPRPEFRIKPENLSLYENGEYFGQPKLNGSASVLHLHEGGDMLLFNRHGEKLSNADTRLIDVFNLQKGGGWMKLCGELMNKNKKGENGESFNQRFVIWDIMMLDNVSLEGETTIRRKEILDHLYGELEMVVNGRGELEQYDHLYCIQGAENCYRVKSYEKNFKLLYNTLTAVDMYEGLVLKRKQGKLEPGLSESNNKSWQVKARKETKNYTF